MLYLCDNDFIVSGKAKSADLVKVDKEKGIEIKQNLSTEGKKVFAACAYHSGQQGVYFPQLEDKDQRDEDEYHGVNKLILGCETGSIIKFELGDDGKWVKQEGRQLAGALRIFDILPNKRDNQVLVCQDGGNFAYVDVVTMDVVPVDKVNGLNDVR